MNKLYKEDIKERFLSTYDNLDTRKTIRNVLYKTFLIEDVLGKDLANFNLNEVGKGIANCVPHNSQTAKSIGRFISSYLDWAIGEGLRDGSNMNPVKGIDPSWYDQFVDKKKVHFSHKEFIELLDSCLNGQDQGFLVFQYLGISGKAFSQLRELKISDVNRNTNEVYIKEYDETVAIPSDLMKYIEKAIDQNTYFYYNSNTKEHTEKYLLNSEYVFRNIESARTTAGMINLSVLYTRLSSIKDEKEISYLTANSLRQSGMIKMAADLYEEYGKLEYEQFALIGDKYHYATVKSPSGEYYNTTLMREFISEENLKSLYNIDIKF